MRLPVELVHIILGYLQELRHAEVLREVRAQYRNKAFTMPVRRAVSLMCHHGLTGTCISLDDYLSMFVQKLFFFHELYCSTSPDCEFIYQYFINAFEAEGWLQDN